MATDFKGLGRRMRSLAKTIERNRSEMVRRAAVASHQTIVLATPVDTGRARSNWHPSIGRPTSRVTGPTSVGSTLADGKAVIRGFSVKRARAIYITNNLPYISRLNDGYSAQAPAGFVEIGLQAGIAEARRVSLLNRRSGGR